MRTAGRAGGSGTELDCVRTHRHQKRSPSAGRICLVTRCSFLGLPSAADDNHDEQECQEAARGLPFLSLSSVLGAENWKTGTRTPDGDGAKVASSCASSDLVALFSYHTLALDQVGWQGVMAASGGTDLGGFFPVGSRVEVLSYEEGFEWSRSEALVVVRSRAPELRAF